MVYSLFYLPIEKHHSLLAKKHQFDDSKVLTPAVRSRLMEKLCAEDSDLYSTCGWATKVMSARDISAGQLKPTVTYNLNAQAMDATIELITAVFAKGINIQEIYIDTIGRPQTYQAKLEPIFPTTKITVAKKADSLYPCVSAASVCAKVTRDAALETCYQSYATHPNDNRFMTSLTSSAEGWGSGYPSDPRCKAWLKGNQDPVFGWGNECRFDWSTVKDLIDAKGGGVEVDWPSLEAEEQALRMTEFFPSGSVHRQDKSYNGLANWFGAPVGRAVI